MINKLEGSVRKNIEWDIDLYPNSPIIVLCLKKTIEFISKMKKNSPGDLPRLTLYSWDKSISMSKDFQMAFQNFKCAYSWKVTWNPQRIILKSLRV